MTREQMDTLHHTSIEAEFARIVNTDSMLVYLYHDSKKILGVYDGWPDYQRSE